MRRYRRGLGFLAASRSLNEHIINAKIAAPHRHGLTHVITKGISMPRQTHQACPVTQSHCQSDGAFLLTVTIKFSVLKGQDLRNQIQRQFYSCFLQDNTNGYESCFHCRMQGSSKRSYTGADPFQRLLYTTAQRLLYTTTFVCPIEVGRFER